MIPIILSLLILVTVVTFFVTLALCSASAGADYHLSVYVEMPSVDKTGYPLVESAGRIDKIADEKHDATPNESCCADADHEGVNFEDNHEYVFDGLQNGIYYPHGVILHDVKKKRGKLNHD